MKNGKRVIVIGSGPGGLLSGMLLAHRGYEVTLLEKNDRLGGRNSKMKVGPYTFDTGPTFLHQKFTLDEIYAEIGRKVDDSMKMLPLDPMTRLSWEEVSMETSSNMKKMREEVERAFPGEGANYERFMRDHQKKLQAIFPCLAKPYHELKSLLSSNLVKAAPFVLNGKSVMDVLDEYFDDERLKLAFTFQAKYLGMSPWSCPGLFSILSYIEYGHGIYHVEGGLAEMSEAMGRTFEEEGGTIRMEAEVEEILFEGSDPRKASGVRLVGGESLECDDLVLNADFAYSRTELFGDRNEARGKMLKKKFSCSTFMLYLGIDKVYEEEPHHHIIFANDYGKNVREIQGEKEVSKDMSVYVRNSSINDKTVAPEGHSQLYVLVPTINNRHGDDWESLQADYRDKVIDRIIAKTGMKDLREHIVEEKILTPKGWEDENIFIGATFNFAHTLDQMLYLRPQNRLKGFDNLYLVGGGTHPGSGLPTIFESARISANLLCEAHGEKHERVDLASEILAEPLVI